MDSRRDPPSSPLADRLLASAFLAITQLEVWVFTADEGYALWLRIAIAATTTTASLALMWRRTRPVWSFYVNSAAIVVSISLGWPSDFYQWTNLVATYSLAAHADRRQAWVGAPVAVGGVLFYFVRFPAEGGPVVAAFAAAMWMVSWLAGRIYGSRIEEARLKAERDLSYELAATQEERLNLERERSRIARELHDVIGHSVNVMVIHAGAGRVALPHDTAIAKHSLEVIEESGRAALGELDRVLSVLRGDEPSGLSPQPDLEQLPNLVKTFEEAGLGVDMLIDGNLATVPPLVSLNAYRVIQESLTNIVKHAGATQAQVAIAVDPLQLELSVSDNGTGLKADHVEGRGFLGMKERAELHGGMVDIASTADGVRVKATLCWDSE